MTVRVWMKPSELGEQGYFIAFADAGGYEAIEDGTLLLFAGEDQVGLVSPGRWDAAQVVASEETVDGE